MKRIFWILALILALAVPASAASRASQVQSSAQIAADGSCQVSITITLHLEESPQELVFPLPTAAENVLLSGGTVNTELRKNHLAVLLPATAPGSYTFSLSYRLPTVMEETKEGTFLCLPLLTGFSYPIEKMEFSVTLPGPITYRPSFYSGYHQEGIEDSLLCTTDGATVTAATVDGLKDHEVLTLRLQVDPSQFSYDKAPAFFLDGWDGAILACIALAAVYYFVCLLPVVPRRVRCITAPEGINAGEVGCVMTGCGPDLTMTVLTWAQLGYIRLELRGSQVTLHKRMDMGNERSGFEVRVFGALFRSRTSVSGTGHHYARLYRKVAAKSPLLHELFQKNSGNPRIFRILLGLAGTLSGVQMALQLPASATAHVLLGLVFGAFTGAFSYFLQSAGKCLPLRDKSPLYIGLGCGVLWLSLGVILRQSFTVAPMVLLQFVGGIGAAFGGRRSERGKRCLAELSSLRRFLVSAPAQDLQQMLDGNPNYYYELAPYALAMGVDKKFAKRFGKLLLPDCSFLDTGRETEMTAPELAALLRQTADQLNALQKRLPYERLTGKSK